MAVTWKTVSSVVWLPRYKCASIHYVLILAFVVERQESYYVKLERERAKAAQ